MGHELCPECEGRVHAEAGLPVIHVPMMTRPPAIGDQAMPPGPAKQFERLALEAPLRAMDRVPVLRLPVTMGLTGPSWLAESAITSGPLAGRTLGALGIIAQDEPT